MEKFVTTRAEYQWDGEKYALVSREGYWYDGEWSETKGDEPPPAPDPTAIARAEARFNRIDQVTPFGNLTFSGPDRNVATLSLSPELQQITDQRLQSDSALLSQALQRQGTLNPNPIDLSQFGPIQSQIDTSGINFSGPQFSGLPALSAPQLQSQVGTPTFQGAINAPNAPNLQRLQSQISSPFQIQNAVQSPFQIQNSVDMGLNTSRLPGIPQDVSQFRDDVTGAIFERGKGLLDDAFSDQERTMRQRLANQGIPESGEAFDRDFERFSRGRNEAFSNLALDAITRGGAEASRALGDVLSARGQGFGEQVTGANLNLAGGQFANQAAGQGFNQALAQGQFGNQAASQGFNQALSQGAFGNEAALAQFGAGLQGAQFGLGSQLAQAGLANQAAQSGFDTSLQAANFANQAGLLGLGAAQGIRGQLTQEQLAQSAAQNQASAQNAAFQQQLLQNQNSGRAQALAEAQGIRGNQFNELASLLGLQQVQAPTMQNFFAPGQSNVTGAFALNQQAQQNAFNANQQQNNAMLSGLFGLGGAFLGGPAGSAALGNIFPGMFGSQ